MRSPFSAKAALIQALVTGPGYGLELQERIRERTGGRVRLHSGSLYPALRALERERLVRHSAEEMRAAIRLFVGGTSPSPPSPRERSLMRERIRRCARVSGFTSELRRHPGTGRKK
jgi:hypothetical protein